MYYDSRMGAINLPEWFTAVQNLPQTQRDISILANTAKQAQAPELQAELRKTGEEVATFAKAQLALQALSTLAILGIFIFTLATHKKGS